MFHADLEDRNDTTVIQDYLGGRKAVFFTGAATVSSAVLENGDELGMTPSRPCGTDGPSP